MGFCLNDFWGIGGGIAPLLLNLLFFGGMVAVLGLGAVWLATRLRDRNGRKESVTKPLEVARRRLAEGKITSAEFEEIRGTLS
jgi:uncharacterized membrane protein